MNIQESQTNQKSKGKTKRVIVSILVGLGGGLVVFILVSLLSFKNMAGMGAEGLVYVIPLVLLGCVLPIALFITVMLAIWLYKISDSNRKDKGRLIISGLGLLGFIIGFPVGMSSFDIYYSLFGHGSILVLFFPLLTGIFLGGLFAAIGGIVLYFSRNR